MENKVEIPQYLYHYTSIDKLALILKNRTIRLNSLDKMDDPQEQKTADVENIGRFFFVSSWTDKTEESIPMWKMYTNPESGVRIKLHSNPFKKQGTYAKDIESVLGVPPNEGSAPFVQTFLDLSKLMEGGYFSVDAWSGNILHKVEYTSDREKLIPQIANVTNGKINLKTEDIGKYKNLHWRFQNEWRYLMMFLKADFSEGPEKMHHKFMLSINGMLRGIELPPFPYYDLEIDPAYFEEMQITASPQMSPGNRILLETLVEKYNPEAKIVDSTLVGLI